MDRESRELGLRLTCNCSLRCPAYAREINDVFFCFVN